MVFTQLRPRDQEKRSRRRRRRRRRYQRKTVNLILNWNFLFGVSMILHT
jgi:hypothetical protein